MKAFLFSLLILIIPISSAFAQTFGIHENGVTVVCDGAQPGDTGSIFGETYTAVSEATLRSMANNNENIETVCTSLITDMNRLFESKSSFNGDISSWDVSNVTNMERMFDRASDFNGDISQWDVSNLTNMRYMFSYARAFNGDISQWDVSNVTNMESMFFGASNFNGDISQWDVSNVTTMRSMFFSAFINGDISQWDVSNVTNMESMFFGASNFNGDISQWDVSNVTNMLSMFYSASNFNGDISQWDVSNVTDMREMFWGASNFNGDLSNWCVDKISASPANFSTNSALTTERSPLWGTCPGKPTAIQLSVPANGALNQSTTPTFLWAVDTSAASYQLQLFEGASTTVLDSTAQTKGLTLQNNLKDNIRYFWKVRGISGNKIGDWSSVWNFTTGVITSISEDLPTETSLQQNYPNPFNPSTQIRFSLAVSSAVVLDVYSIDGTKVASLVNQVLNAGWHTATFNAANLPTGLYLYRLNTGNQQITKKMMLMK